VGLLLGTHYVKRSFIFLRKLLKNEIYPFQSFGGAACQSSSFEWPLTVNEDSVASVQFYFANTTLKTHLVSISSTFYAQIFHTNSVSAAFL